MSKTQTIEVQFTIELGDKTGEYSRRHHKSVDGSAECWCKVGFQEEALASITEAKGWSISSFGLLDCCLWLTDQDGGEAGCIEHYEPSAAELQRIEREAIAQAERKLN